MKKYVYLLLQSLIWVRLSSQVQPTISVIPFDSNRVECRVHGGNADQTQSYVPPSAFPSSLIVTCSAPGVFFKIYYMDMLLGTGEGFDDPVLGPLRRNTYCAVLNYIASTFSMNPATAPAATTLDIFVDQSNTPINNPSPPGTATLAVGGPFFVGGGYGVTPGFYGGNFRSHVLTGVDPDPSNYDGVVRLNFDMSLGQPVTYWDDYLNTSSSCRYDLYSLLLHETTHMMGWVSAVGESAAPAYTLAILSNNSNIPSFTEFDKIFLYRGDITTPGSFQKLVTVSPPGLGAPAGISGLLRNFPATGNLGTWMTASVAPYNHKAYDAYYPFHETQPNGYTPGSFLSHMDLDLTSFVRATQFSPGYQQKYVMGPFLYRHAMRREYSLAELRYLNQLGYTYNTGFAASTSLSNGATTNANLLNNNVAPYRSNYANPANNIWYFPAPSTSPINMKASRIWPETKNADFTITNNQNCPPGFPSITQLVINLSTFPTTNISDPNGDPIYIYPNSLYGIRGVSTGTSVNNHDCLVQTASNTVVYTPPPGFIGRAEFAFQMWDGKEPGGIKNITIDVLNNSCNISCGNELMLNGNTEDATEAKTISNNLIPNTCFNDFAFIYGPNFGDHFVGAMPYGNLINAASSQSGTHRKESTEICFFNLPPPPNGSVSGFGNVRNTFGTIYAPTPGIAAIFPTAFPNNPTNECYIYDNGFTNCHYRTLINPLIKCSTYNIEFDVSFSAGYAGLVGQPYTFTIEALNSITPDFTPFNVNASNYTAFQSIPITVTVSAITSTVLNTNWQHVTASFFYCGANARYLSFKGFGGTYIDNLSLKKSCSPPPPLIIGANATTTLLCPGASATLQAFALNSSCFTTYTWQPGNIVSPTIAITFTSVTQSYTLLANDGCRSASAVVNPVPLPVGSFTAPPICIGNCSNDLYTILPVGTPTNGSFSGPNILYPFCVPNPCAFVCLTGGTYTPGVYNYTYTVANNLNCLSTYTFNIQYLSQPVPTIGITGGGTCINSGQTLTLTALTNPSAGITYTWMPGGSNSSSIVITPTATTVYSVTTNNGFCTSSSAVTINVIPSVTFTNTPPTLCTGQYIYYLENWLAAGIPTGGVWTAPFITSPTGTPGLTAGYLNPNITPLGTQTISYSYTLAPGCVATNQFTVNIIAGFVLNTNGLSTYCTNLGLGAVISATATPSVGVSFTWQPGNLTGPTQTVSPPSQTIYTVTASNGPCTFQDIVTVQVSSVCCPAANYINSAIIGNTATATFITGQWAINQNVTVIGEVFLQGEFLAAANVSITVSPNATLTTDRNGAHIYSCSDMWQGIDVLNGGHVKFVSYDVIEDGIEAIRSIGSTNTSTTNPTIWLLNTTINRCKYGVVIKNYNQPTNNSPFVFTNCVFTSRNLNITPGSLTFLQWTAATAPALLASNGTSVLASPYLVGGYPSANLKAPNAGRPTFAGVYLENNGASFGVVNPTPVYFGILVGDISKPASPCLFDNLMHGIYSKNSNFISRSNIFQNTRRFLNPPKSYIGGIGIYAVNDLTNSINPNSYFSTVDPALPGTSINHFYDCHFGIYAYNIHQIDARFDDYRSTQSNPNINGPTIPGQFAIYSVSNKFKNYQISGNRIQNISTGIYVAAYPSAMNMPPFPNFGAYMDRIFITNNFFSPALSATAAIGTGYVNYAVVAVSNISGFSGANTFYTPGAQLSIRTNTMDRVFRGSYVSDFSNKNFTAFTANNGITMVQAPNPPSPQHGIEHLLNTADVVNTNTIVGTAVTLNNNNDVGVYRSMNSSGSTQCNSVVSVYAGFEFAGANVGAFWRNNILNTNRRGLQLTNNAILSAQGSSVTPSDNLWQGLTWSLSNLNTWTDNSTFPANSKLYVRTVPVGSFNPVFNGNQGNFILQEYGFINNSLGTSNNNAPFAACLPQGGGGCNNCSPAMITSLESIVQDSIQYLGNVNETSEINKNIAFTNVVNEPTLAVASQTINNFYTSNILLTRGKYSDIEGNIKQGNFNQASALIANFSPVTNIENNYRDYYSILKNYLSNGFISNQEDANLSQIANKCPFVDGGVVYDARNLYGVINEKIVVYDDQNCDKHNEHGGGHNGRMINGGTNGNKTTENYSQFDLVPNPASDQIKIVALGQDGDLRVIIRDLAGKLIFEKTVALRNHFAILELDLFNGMYLVEISNGFFRENKKIIISK